jgi:hypothetical protein
MWAIAAGVYLCGSVIALALTRRLQVETVPEPDDEPPPRMLFGVLADRRAAGRAAQPPPRREKVEAGDAVSTGAS